MKPGLLLALLLVVALGGTLTWLILREDGARDGPGPAESPRTASRLSPPGGTPPARDEAASERALTSPERAAEIAALRKALAGFGIDPSAIPEDQLPVTGRLVSRVETTEDDAEPSLVPIPGAEVAFLMRNTDGSVDSAPTAQAVSRDDGRFLTTLPRSAAWRLRATAPGHVGGGPDLPPLGAPGRDLGDIALLRAATVTIVVTTGRRDLQEATAPVAGMKIQILEGEEVLAEGSTADDGHLELRGLPRKTLRLVGELTPYARLDQPIEITRDGEEIRLKVDVVGRIRVRAQAHTGAFLARFSVAVDVVRSPSQYYEPRYQELETTDPEGWAVVENIRAGKVDVYATARGFALGREKGVKILPAETSEVSVELPPGFPLRGRVVSKKDGNPVADAIVFSERDILPYAVDTNSRDAYQPMARAARTDNRGLFRLEDLTEGSHRLTAVHPDFAASGVQAVEVGKEGEKEVVVELRGGCNLSGHVYNGSGVPVEGVQVMVITIMDPNSTKKVPLMATTDEGGYYRIEHVHPGFQGIIKILRRPTPGEQPYEMKQQRFVDGQDVVVDFGNPGSGAVVRGRITMRDGSPATDVAVMLMQASEANEVPPFFTGPVDAQGGYQVTGVPPGTYLVMLSKANKGGDFHGQETLKVPETGVVNHDIVVSGGSVRGTVVSATTGAPLGEGEVSLMIGETQWVGRSDLDPDGSYSFDYVPEGTYVIYASVKDHGTKNVTGIRITDGQETVVPPIELSGGGRVVGRVLDTAGQPVAGATIYVVDPATGEPAPIWGGFNTDEDGNFEVPHIPAGSYGISAFMEGRDFQVVQVTVAVGGAPQIVVREE